jgi:hypothetical protein
MEPDSVPPPTGIPVLLQLGLLLLLTGHVAGCRVPLAGERVEQIAVTLAADMVETGDTVQAGAQDLFENCTGTGQAIWCSQEPLQVAGELRFRDVAPSVHHTCGVTTAGSAYCWGRNDGGQVGDGTTGSERRRPVRVGG